MKLSKRLQQVANFVPKDAKVADIGSDHAYLPVFLVESGQITQAIAGEVNQGPYETAQRTVEEAGLTDMISVRKGNGLEVLTSGEVNVITIAGMGGGTIVDILSADKQKLWGISRLILQPMVDSDQLRKWLHQNHWRIVAEELVFDDRILYEVLVAEPGEEQYEHSIWYEIGNVNLLLQHPLFAQRIQMAIGRIDRVLTKLKLSQSEEVMRKASELQQKRHQLEEVLSLCK